MRHMYTVTLDIKYGHKGKRSWWGGDEEFNVVANGDAMGAVTKAKKLALKKVIDLTDEPVAWIAQDSRLVEVRRKCEVHGS
jgi:hypothetical protein